MRCAFQLAVVSQAFSANPRQAVEAARRAGFAGIQFDAFSPTLNLCDLSQTGRREFQHLLSSQEQQLASIRVDLGAKGLAPGADIDRILARLSQAMDAVVGLAPRQPLLCVELGPLPEPARAPAPRPKITSEQAGKILLPSTIAPAPPEEPARAADTGFENHVDNVLKEIGRLADRRNAVVAFRTDLASFAALHRALAAAACPWFGVDLDPVAILRDRRPITEIFDTIGVHIRHVRGRDALAGHDRRTKPAALGQGTTNWSQFLSLLDDSGFGGWITVDPLELPDRPAGAATALATIAGAK